MAQVLCFGGDTGAKATQSAERHRQDQRLAVPLPDMSGQSQESPPHFHNQIPLKDLTNPLDTLLLASGMFSPPYYKVIVTKRFSPLKQAH